MRVTEIVKPDARQHRLREVAFEDLAEQVRVGWAPVRLGEHELVVEGRSPQTIRSSSWVFRHDRSTATVRGSRSIVRRPVAVFTSSTIIW